MVINKRLLNRFSGGQARIVPAGGGQATEVITIRGLSARLGEEGIIITIIPSQHEQFQEGRCFRLKLASSIEFVVDPAFVRPIGISAISLPIMNDGSSRLVLAEKEE